MKYLERNASGRVTLTQSKSKLVPQKKHTTVSLKINFALYIDSETRTIDLNLEATKYFLSNWQAKIESAILSKTDGLATKMETIN